MTEYTDPKADLLRQLAHWQRALDALLRFDELAAPAAWGSLEPAMAASLRDAFATAGTRLHAELATMARQAMTAGVHDAGEHFERLGDFRRRYSRFETTVDFYGDAINSRTDPVLQATLGGLDRLAALSMHRLLDPLQRSVPPVLSYVDRGLGASILKAGLRLWEPSIVSPAAAIKIARHNLMRPTALIHETGHQVAHILGWNEELAARLDDELAADSRELAATWASWASEIAADSFAFVHTGWASVLNLHDVLAGDGEHVLRFVPGDPHPVSYVRVLLGVEMCNAAFGRGPWLALAEGWLRRYPLADADLEVAGLMRASIPHLPRIARTCLFAPLAALGGRALAHWIDPLEVAPAVLTRLDTASGKALTRSPALAGAEPLRVLALLGLRIAGRPDQAQTNIDEQQRWLRRLNPLPALA